MVRLDPMWEAMSNLRRGRHEKCIELCNNALNENPSDQAFWALKCRAVTAQGWIDDVELDEGVDLAESLLDDNAVASLPRPGTSMNAPQTASKVPSAQSLRPITQGGRPMSGFARPGSSSSRPQSGDLRDALQSSSRRLGTAAARPMTNLGREVRLGTASLAHSATGSLVDVGRLDIKKYAARTGIAMQLVDYLLYVERNPRKALELCAEATREHEFKDWWFKARLAKSYAKLGLLRDAERQYKSSLKDQPIIDSYLELALIYLRLDLPNTALDVLHQGLEKFSLEPRLLVAIARIHEGLNKLEESVSHYRKVISLDAGNIEALACIGAHYFYSDQPEMAQRYYRRLLQMGIKSSPLFNNIGLCCFYASQYDMALSCFDRALTLATDEEMADIWYNVGHVGVALGDLGLAHQAFKVSVSIDPAHPEALNNLAVLELRRKKNDSALNFFNLAIESNEFHFEAHFNRGVMALKQGDFQAAHVHSKKASQIYPAHVESQEVLDKLHRVFLASMA